jgi:hypothetical protein
MIAVGQAKCKLKKQYWAEVLHKACMKLKVEVVIVPDLRMKEELDFFIEKVGRDNILHLNIYSAFAKEEPFDDLSSYADYIMEY